MRRVTAALRHGALALNLFYNYAVDARRMTTFEAITTYVFLVVFGAIAALYGVEFFSATHQAYHCGSPTRDICVAEFVICQCAHKTVTCAEANLSEASCVCCAYGTIHFRASVLMYAGQVGGLFTTCIGVAIIVVGIVRWCLVDRRTGTDTSTVTVELNPTSPSMEPLAV
jgi:uncharacterized membrane protein YidH (DUF202 family)